MMTSEEQDEIVEMTRQAGISTGTRFVGNELVECVTIEIQAFAKLVAEKSASVEREACAKFFDDNNTNLFWGSQAASHIRARGDT